ncbi:HAD-IA family hydrolase [Sphingomonas sp.]|uniref:HAD-IA family hydrolase n=1 Tax=Sphingomonas sp. TaxID=28214 RepID=UPI001B07E129|nr:HAD-IA family hydrolase [Sphingomonas sp.]MBO9712706.1 HAD-IA family hydrolase [Sphingomonas sp.]
MTDFPFQVVGFDLDGTLFDTSGDLAAATNHALSLAGRPTLAVEEVKRMIGGGARRMLQRGLEASGGCDDAQLDQLFPQLLSYYEGHIARETRPYPGLLDAMDALDGLGVKLGIVTNKLEYLTVKLVNELGLAHRFAAVIGVDTMGKGSAKPSPLGIQAMIERCGGGRAAFVGDSDFDIAAARNAGIPAVAVSFGFLAGPVEDLAADAVVHRYAELVPVLAGLA